MNRFAWRRRGAVLAAAALVALAALAAGAFHAVAPAAAAAAAEPPAFVDGDHDGIDDNLEQQLANTFAPAILVEPDESNYPVTVDWFLQHAQLAYHEDCSDGLDEPLGWNPLGDQAGLLGPPWKAEARCGTDDTGYSHPPHREITTLATDPDGLVSAGAQTTGYADQQTFFIPDLPDSLHVGSTNPSDWTTYFHAYPSSGGGVMIQYWHLFAYNDLDVLGFGDHGGDWDAEIQVELKPDLRTIQEVTYSRHGDDHPGDVFPFDTFTVVDGTHPLMAIDGGGHAAFASPKDFCENHSLAGGRIAWPVQGADALDPATLGTVDCLFDPPVVGPPSGGIVWETWTGGTVRSAGAITHPLTGSVHGPLLNLGEYNPCTATTCYGSSQASPLLAGQFYPLNGQIFIEYSGLWGTPPSCGGLCMSPPRGPVFQGWDPDFNEYTSWYNRAASAPASEANAPWKVVPWTTTSFVGFSSGGYVATSTRMALKPFANQYASAFGATTSYYRVYADGTAPPAFSEYTGPFAIGSTGGTYHVDYYSVDALLNREKTYTYTVVVDTEPPTAAWSSAGSIALPDGSFQVEAPVGITLTVNDASGSGRAYYRVYPVGTTPPAQFTWLEGTLSLGDAPGEYELDYYGVDGAGNRGPTSAVLLVNHVPPDGATARCNDGTYSFSQHRRGTCSYHGGVAVWLQDIPA